ncbi:MAG: DUF6779 domain-containing protein [Geodermatophilaceae bacterium]
MAGWRTARVVRRAALLVGLGLAITATATLVLTEDLKLLRLAVIAALWAFLIAAFVAGQRRDSAAHSPDRGADVALAADLEATERREFELRTEVRLRGEIEDSLREDVTALRGDLARLRHDILERWDGELRVERVAVRAESTRVTGFGATFHTLQDEARRLHEEGRPMFEVASSTPHREELDTASTVEFTVVPPALTVDDVVQMNRTATAPPQARGVTDDPTAAQESGDGAAARQHCSRPGPGAHSARRRRAAASSSSCRRRGALERRVDSVAQAPSRGRGFRG